jgi:type II restriction/modification system DNA methylase subunit YeeA
MAWPDEPWVLNGADVRISIVGFDDGSQATVTLAGHPVAGINSDLTSLVDVTAAAPLPENFGIAFMGDTKGGAFDVSAEVAREWLALPLNPNGRPNDDVLKPWFNGLDVTRRPRGMWIIDFGVDMTESEAALYEAPFRHVEQNVKPERQKNKRESYRRKWWIHAEPRPRMRQALSGLDRSIVTPTVAKHRLFTWQERTALPDHQLIVFARQDDYFFGVLQSRAHEVWSLRAGTWLGVGNDPRYTPTTCFETFPLPWSPGQEPWRDPSLHAIVNAAHELHVRREAWLNPPDATEAELKKRTLTNLYNARPAWLAAAHGALDRAVWAAYGWDDLEPQETPDEEILGRLLQLNRERPAGRTAVGCTK